MRALTTFPVPAGHVLDFDDITHLTCCDDDVALCGLDVADYDFADDEDPTTCPMCADVEESGQPCPVLGCGGES